MHTIPSPLHLGAAGPEVANLQEILMWLINNGTITIGSDEIVNNLSEERLRQVFGSATVDAVRLYQNDKNIAFSTPVLDWPTLNSINAAIAGINAAEPVVLQGHLRNDAGDVVSASYQIKLFKASVNGIPETALPWMQTNSDANGAYSFVVGNITEDAAPLRGYQIRAVNATTGVSYRTLTTYLSGAVQHLDVVVSDADAMPGFEYNIVLDDTLAALSAAGSPALVNVDLDSTDTRSYLEAATGETFDKIRALVLASRLSQKLSGFNPGFLYALSRFNVSMAPEVLVTIPDEQLKKAAQTGFGNHLIPSMEPGTLTETINALRTALFNLLAQAGTAGGGSANPADSATFRIFNKVLNNPEKTSLFLKKYFAYVPDGGTNFWDTLIPAQGESNPPFPLPVIANLKLASILAIVTGSNPALVSRLFRMLKATPLEGDPAIAGANAENPQPGLLAGLVLSQWFTVISNARNQDADNFFFPEFVEGSTEATRKESYAAYLDKYTDEIFPTTAISRDIAAAPETPFTQLKQGLSTFVANNPGFDLRVTPYTELAQSSFSTAGIADVSGFIEEIGTVQRLMNLSPQYAQIAAMAESGYTSSMKIARASLSSFSADVEGAVSLSAATAIYDTAKNIANTSITSVFEQWVELSQADRVPRVTDWTVSIPEEAYAEWRSLFGALDGCSCSECQSVYSAAAYFTDVLHYMETLIRDRGVFTELTERRRPDLRHINLTCKNANTPVPQIDIINEVLEDLVSNQANNPLAPANQYRFYARQTGADAAQQRAIPEHVNTGDVTLKTWALTGYTGQVTVKTPYPTLKAAVYPWTLPYNFYKRQIDTYLDLPGVKGHELVQRFGSKNKLQAWDDMVFCTEYLGVSVERMTNIVTPVGVIPTNVAPLLPHYGLKLSGSTIASIPDPAKRGSSLPVAFGSWIATLGGRVDVFLQQTGLSYTELLHLKDCYCINPFTVGTSRKLEIVPIDPVNEPDTCQLERLKITGLDGYVLQLLYRFVQMSRALGWSFYELDRAFLALGIVPGTGATTFTGFTAADAKKLVQLKHIVATTGLSIEQACILYTDIDTRAYRDYGRSEPADVPSLYARIFRNPLVFDVDDVNFPFNAAATFPTAVNRDVLLNYLAGVLNIPQQELRDFPTTIIPVGTTISISLATLSRIYREAMLIRMTGYTVRDWFRMKDWFSDPAHFGTASTDPYDQPINFGAFNTYETIRMLEFAAAHRETAITADSIAFLLEDKHSDSITDDRQNAAMAEALTSLHNELLKRWPGGSYAAAGDTDGKGLQSLLELVTDSDKAKQLIAVVQDTARFEPGYVQSRVLDFINKDLSFFLPTGSDDDLVFGMPGFALTTAASRRGLVYDQLRTYVTEQTLKPAVYSAMAKHYKADEKLIEATLSQINFGVSGMNGLDHLIGILDLNNPVFERWTMPAADYSFETIVQLNKAMVLIGAFGLRPDELGYLWQRTALLSNSLRVQDLPYRSGTGYATGQAATVAPAPYRALYTFFRWMKVRDFVSEKSLDLFQLIRETYAPTSIQKSPFLDRLKLVFKTNRTDIDTLLNSGTPANGVLNAAFAADYQRPEVYLRVRDALEMQFLLPASMSVLAKIATAIYTAATQSDANEIIHVVKAQYAAGAWLEAVRPVSDKLRIERRDAMVAYLLANPPSPYEYKWYASNDIFETLLIDVEMSPCMPTTRILLGINSMQLWMDRVLMGLEKNTTSGSAVPLKVDKEPGRQWASWRKRYRIWEANRKIFIYPENWIEPELRDDKTPLFLELEKFLKQNEVTKDNVELAYSTYLERLDELAHLEIVAIYRETHQTNHEVFMYNPGVIDRDVVHVFGRTPAHPHIYYYRKRIGDEWTAWTKMDVQVDGEHFVPVMWRGRLRLYWLSFMKEQLTDAGNKMRSSQEAFVTPPSTRYKINLAWTELKNDNWTAKQISKSSLFSMNIEEENLVSWDQLWFFHNREWAGKEVRAWYPAGTLDRQLKERFYFYSTLDSEGNLAFGVHEKVVRNSSPSLDGRLYGGNISPALTKGRDNDLPGRLRQIDSHEKYNDVFHAGAGSFRVMFNDVKASPITPSPANLHQPFNGSGVKDVNSLEKRGYSSWYTDYRYLPDANNKPQTGSGYYHFPNNNVKLLNRAPDTDLQDKARGKYLVFTRDVPKGYSGPSSIIRMPFFFYKDNDNSFFVEEVHISTETSRPALTTLAGLDDTSFSFLPTAGVFAGNGGAVFSGAGLSFSGGDVVAFDVSPSYRIYYRFHNFFHNRVYDFRQKLFQSGIEGLLDRSFVDSLNHPSNDTIRFASTYQPTTAVMQKDTSGRDVYPSNNVDFSYDAAFSQYNWEIFFHIPLLIANKLSLNQQFDDARKWYHYIFNPTVANNLTAPTTILDFWNFTPFYQRALNVPSIYQIMQDANLNAAVQRWANDPFKPHLVARTRITAYMKTTVMKYLDNLIAWGDALFRTDSREDIVEATLLYVLAAQLLGRKPKQIPPRAFAAVQTYASLQSSNSWNAFSNAMVKIESYMLTSGTTPTQAAGTGQKPANTAQMYFFCIPPNSKLNAYWDIIADRLFKIRNCQNIDGVTRDLALYDPPIDPALLVKAAAAGISATEAVAAANAPLPVYRFQVLAQKATEIAGEVKALGSQLLSALEKKDAEKLGLLRSSQELRVMDAVTELKEKSIEEAAGQINALDQQRNMVTTRRSYYQRLIDGGLNGEEQFQLDSLRDSIPLYIAQGVTQSLSSILYAVPEFHLGPFMAGVRTGGANLGNLTAAAATLLGIETSVNSVKGSMAGIKGSYKRRSEEWAFQVKSADAELLQLDKQVISAQIRMAIAEADLKNHKLQRQNALDMDEAMRSKYTNEELYDWMIGQISFTYTAAYKLALNMAMKAERCYQNELNLATSDFISTTYWDSLHKGLMAGETLAYDIKRMEASYLDKNKRQLELSKHISLAALDPQALLNLKTNKECRITIPEWIYDMDYPGHHMRRIKSVSISIPCVAGPYTTVSCKLSLLKSSYRAVTTKPQGYAEIPAGNDDRFRYVYGNIQSIATSHGQNDSGMFDFSFRDERYLPFEGAGAISEWRIELPAAYAQFDYDSISDVILHVNYTAQDEGGLAQDAGTEVNAKLEGSAALGFMSIFSLKHEFSDAWYAYGSNFANTPVPLKLRLSKDLYPMYSKGRQVSVQPLRLVGKWKKTGTPPALTIDLSYWNGMSENTVSISGSVNGGYVTFNTGFNSAVFTVNANTKLLKLVLKQAGVVKNMDEIFDDLYLVNLNRLVGSVSANAQNDPDWSDATALPNLPSGAKAWWMADAGITRDQTSGNVVAWADQTLSGNPLQAASTLQQPLYFPNGGPNNKPYLKFDGSRSLHCPGFTLAAQPARTVFMVFRNTTVNNVGVAIEMSPNFQYYPGTVCIATNDGYNNHIATSHAGNMGLAVGGQNITLNQWSSVRFRNDFSAAPPAEATTFVNNGPGGNMSYWVGNGADNTGNFATSHPLFLGSRNNNGAFLRADIAEVIIFERDLNPSEVTTVETYLKSKYSL